MASDAQRIDWSTAEVTDRALSVDFTEPPGKPWRKDFQGVVGLLGRDGQDGWGAIALKKGRIEVAEVAEGSEADLRHFLESAVLQANSHFGTASAGPAADEDAPETPDRRMTATFKRFGLPTQ